ncbi:MAG: outer membrane lipoprotein LolB [Rhodoferax sp.]|nr:outer membrane lipoprotein LolB [Rhodoferax sp.]
MKTAASAWWTPFAIALLLAGCASPPPVIHTPGQPVTQWGGRLALRIDADPVQSFSAAFELKGNAQAGQLSLYSPLGATIAQMAWAPGDARLRWDGKERTFDSMDALTLQATGTELPVISIFQWLAGENVSTSGWQADLRELPKGRIFARRSAPLPSVEMRLVLE